MNNDFHIEVAARVDPHPGPWPSDVAVDPVYRAIVERKLTESGLMDSDYEGEKIFTSELIDHLATFRLPDIASITAYQWISFLAHCLKMSPTEFLEFRKLLLSGLPA